MYAIKHASISEVKCCFNYLQLNLYVNLKKKISVK